MAEAGWVLVSQGGHYVDDLPYSLAGRSRADAVAYVLREYGVHVVGGEDSELIVGAI